MRYLPAIDGLRAIAVLAVVAYHAGLPVPAGFVGVDVFFVISGYVITRMLAREQQASGRIDMIAFYARRVRRILPALVVVVVATVAAAAIMLPDAAFARVVDSAAAALSITANIHFQNVTGGYFDQDSALAPLLHTWSLSVEEQFYFIWPLLLVLVVKRRWLLAALALCSLALAQWGLAVDPEAAFFQMPARFWELAVGGLIALAPQRSVRGLAPAGLVVLAIAIAFPMPSFPGVGALPAVIGTGMIIHAVHGGGSIRALELAPVRFVGLISYSLYLWHWPLLALYRATHLQAPGVAISLALCGVAGMLAWLSYRFIETPARRGWRSLPAGRVVGAGAGACLALILTAMPVMHRAEASATAVEQQFTAPDLPPTVALWGDSHALAWQPFAAALAHKEGRGLAVLTLTTCPPTLGYAMTVEDAAHPKHSAMCLQHNAAAVHKLAAGQYDTVIIAARWLPLFNQMPAGFHSNYPTDTATIAAMTNGFYRSLDRVAPHARRLVIIGPVPQLKATPERCIASGEPELCGMTKKQFQTLAAAPRAFLATLAKRYPNVEVIDPEPLLCDDTRCPAAMHGAVLYRDDDHVSPGIARQLARQWLARRGGLALP